MVIVTEMLFLLRLPEHHCDALVDHLLEVEVCREQLEWRIFELCVVEQVLQDVIRSLRWRGFWWEWCFAWSSLEWCQFSFDRQAAKHDLSYLQGISWISCFCSWLEIRICIYCKIYYAFSLILLFKLIMLRSWYIFSISFKSTHSWSRYFNFLYSNLIGWFSAILCQKRCFCWQNYWSWILSLKTS